MGQTKEEVTKEYYERIDSNKNYLICFLIFLFMISILKSGFWWTETSFKEYIIEHRLELEINENDSTTFSLDYDGLYFTNITIALDKDSYNVIIWGNRETFLYDMYSDNQFLISSNEYTVLDKQLVECLRYKIKLEEKTSINTNYYLINNDNFYEIKKYKSAKF